MTKSAVLVGCNYAGTNAALSGCINDVSVMYELLTERFGFPGENITVLIDSEHPLPTGVNIKNALLKMVTKAQPGDTLFFHFSGHGVQVPSEDPVGAEIDGKDECIVPCDFNLIVDHDLKSIVKKVPAGARFTMVSDCCHSGTMLDGENVVIEGIKEAPNQGLLSVLMSSALGQGRSINLETDEVDVINRALPLRVLHETLSKKAGHCVQRGNIHSSLAEVFGKDSSKASRRVKRVMDKIDTKLGGKLSGLFKSGKKNHEEKERGLFSSAMGFIQEAFAGDGGSTASYYRKDEDDDDDTDDDVEEKKTHVDVEVPVLITGCQSHETSADACPGGDKSKAFGALTNAISTVMKAHPGGISNRDLVMSVREYLKIQRFPQNPCLECGSHNATVPFVC